MNLFKKTPAVQGPTHDHSWDIITKTYAPPRKDLQGGNFSESLQEKLLFGVTTLLSECTICHERLVEELIGTDEQVLEEIMDKADAFGPQYVNRGDSTYVIGRYYPVVDNSNIPVR